MYQADRFGYYSRLGVSPSASAAEIKAAYRAKAMAFHPDRNPDQDTTEKFQEIVQAYSVLSNSNLRIEYDELSDAQVASEQSQGMSPVYCSRCNCVSPMSRFRSFTVVFGYVVGSRMRQHQGVFCPRCEPIVAIQSTALSLFLGWWALPAALWTLKALVQNTVGGPFYVAQNARMLAHQAHYFRSIGQDDVAQAVAVRAYKLLLSDKSSSWLNRDSVDQLKQELRTFIDFNSNHDSVTELKERFWFRSRGFFWQFSLIALVFSSLVGLVAYGMLSVAQEKESALVHYTAQEPVKRVLDLPDSGLYGSSKPESEYSLNTSSSLDVDVEAGTNFFIKLNDITTGETELTLFVRGGERVEVPVSPGVYQIKFALGASWYGEQEVFGPDTQYKQLDVQFEFWKKGKKQLAHALRLDSKPDNISREISASEF